MGFRNSTYRNLNIFEITYTKGELKSRGKPLGAASNPTEAPDSQTSQESGESGVDETPAVPQAEVKEKTSIADRLEEFGITGIEPPNTLKFFTTSEFSISFSPQQTELLNFGTGVANKLAGVFGQSFIIDFPQAVIYTGMEAVNWSMDGILSIYETPGASENYDDLEQVVFNRYCIPLAVLLVILLPYRTKNKANFKGTIDQIVDILQNIAPNLFSSKFITDVQSKADSTAESFQSWLEQQAEGTIFEAFVKEAYYVDPPLQYAIQTDPSAGLGLGMSFRYGPVEINNINIKSLKISFGNLLYKLDKSGKQIGIPEAIKVHFDFTCQYKPSIEMLKQTIENMKA